MNITMNYYFGLEIQEWVFGQKIWVKFLKVLCRQIIQYLKSMEERDLVWPFAKNWLHLWEEKFGWRANQKREVPSFLICHFPPAYSKMVMIWQWHQLRV